MKISVWWSGKTKAPFQELVKSYEKRIGRLHQIEIKTFVVKKGLNPGQQIAKESDLILNQLGKKDRLFLLDEKGKGFSSTGFADFIQSQQMIGRPLVFVIGGPYGFSEALYIRSDGQISLSQMTFTHDMVRVIFLEQLYRAFTIQQNLPYHHN